MEGHQYPRLLMSISLGEKLQVLQALVGKLLTLASSRDLMEDCVEDQRAVRQELREVRAEQHRREREEAAYRYTTYKQITQQEGGFDGNLSSLDLMI